MVDDMHKRKKKLKKLVGIVTEKRVKIDHIQGELDRDQALLASLKNKAARELDRASIRMASYRPENGRSD